MVWHSFPDRLKGYSGDTRPPEHLSRRGEDFRKVWGSASSTAPPRGALCGGARPPRHLSRQGDERAGNRAPRGGSRSMA